MASPVAVRGDTNQYATLDDEGKTWSSSPRSRFGKDDVKEQAFRAREGIKAKAIDLKEQIVSNPTVQSVAQTISSGVEQVKEKVKEKAGMAGKTDEEVVNDVSEQATGQWEAVKRKGNRQLRQAENAIDAKLDEKLTPAQRHKLNKTAKQAKQSAIKMEQQAEKWSDKAVIMMFRSFGPSARPMMRFILRNNLSLPFVAMMALATLWLTVGFIRFLTPSPKPELDITSKEATMAWLKYHAGEFKDKASDVSDSLSDRAAHFLSNHDWENLKSSAVNWRDIGMNQLGLREPSYSEWIWARLTGQPITWQERVSHVLGSAKAGIAAQAGSSFVNGVKDKLVDGFDTLRSHLPGSGDVKDAASTLTEGSTLDRLSSGASYLKNRVVHGAEAAAHRAQEAAQRVADEARYKAGL